MKGIRLFRKLFKDFLEIVLQADPKTIIPPYLKLYRSDKSVSDLSTVFPVSAVSSFHVMKKYFFRLSNRDDNGFNWCSIILAQSIPFLTFMEKAKYSLENNDFSLSGLRPQIMKMPQTSGGYCIRLEHKTKNVFLNSFLN